MVKNASKAIQDRINWVSACAKRFNVPYASGETPARGDYIKNQWEQPATVLEVGHADDGEELVSVRWDDGGDLPFTSAKEFTLISRNA